MSFDVLIKGGTVVDGTGERSFRADVAIDGDRIAAIGDLSGAEAGTTVDASGRIVCPGFIDVHVHSEIALLGGQDRYAPLRMGVTTQLAGPDGFSWAPLGGEKLRETFDYYRTFYDQEVLEGMEHYSIRELLDLWRGRIPANLVMQVPHASIRIAAMGWAARAATEEELQRMRQLTREWCEAGAKAFSTGLEYEPTRHADLNELVRLSETVKEYGGLYVAHQRGYGRNIFVGCAETFAIGRQAGVPVHISHLTLDDDAGKLVDAASEEGLDVSFDMYPYPAGCTSLLFMLPADIQAGSVSEVRDRLTDRAVRARIRRFLDENHDVTYVRFAALGISGTGWEGKSLAEVRDETGRQLEDLICDTLLESDFQALMVYHWTPDRFHWLEKTYRHPLHMVSTDGVYKGLKPHPRGYGTYPKILRRFVNENNWLTVEQAIYKMSGFPAARFGIAQRGTLKQGNYADVVVFHPDEISDGATFETPRAPNEGIEAVFVNGRLVMKDGDVYDTGSHGRVV